VRHIVGPGRDAERILRPDVFGAFRIVRAEAGGGTGREFKHSLRVFDESRRFNPLFDDNDRTTIEADTVILSVGQATDLSFLDPEKNGIALKAPGIIQTEPATLATTAPGVFVAGELAHGPKLMIHAIASGKQAGRSVYQSLPGQPIEPEAVALHSVIEQYRREKDYEKPRRVPIPVLDVNERLANPKALVERGYDDQLARCEASRCLDCGVNTIFDSDRCILCGGCIDACPTLCLKLVGADELAQTPEVAALMEMQFGKDADLSQHSAILKDETICIRCANCAQRCPTRAIT